MKFPVHEFEEKWYNAQGFGVKTDYGYHDGCDLNLKTGGDTDLGQELLAVADGEITSVHSHATVPSFGKHLHLKCKTPFGDIWAHYAHCQDILVSEGTQVKEGQLIAHLGKSGTKVAHCHFAIKNQPTGVDGIAKTLDDLKKWEDPILFIENQNKPSTPATSPQPADLELHQKVDELSLRVAEAEISQTQTKDEVNKIVPRLDSIAHDISDLNKDRAILETIQGKMAGIEEKVKLNSETVKSSETNLKAEIRGLQASTSDEIESIKVRVKVLEEKPTSETGITIIKKWGRYFLGKLK